VGKPKGRGKVERFFSSLEQRLLDYSKLSNKIYTLAGLKDFIINDYLENDRLRILVVAVGHRKEIYQ